MYLTLKYFHLAFAVLAISGFVLRGFWVFSGSPLRQNRATRVLPHINDTLFLASGIWLVAFLNLPWTQLPWLLAKFAGLLAYIGLGMVAFRFGKTASTRAVAFVAAVASFAYVVGAALTKSPLSWLAA